MFSFFNKEDRAAEEHLANLISLAKADNDLANEELKLIYHVADNKGIPHSTVKKMIEKEYNFIVPEGDEAKFDLIYDLVEMMLADDVIDDDEMKFCSDAAKQLGFRMAIVEILVRKISIDLKEGLTKDEIIKDTKRFI